MSNRTGGWKSSRPENGQAPDPKGRWDATSPSSFAARQGPSGSEQDDVPRPHPRRRLPARDPPALAALAAPGRCAGDRSPRR